MVVREFFALRRAVAGLGERARAGVAGGGVGGRGGGADVAERARVLRRADEMAARRMTAGARRDDARRPSCCSGIAVAHYSFGRRGSRVGAALFVDRRVRRRWRCRWRRAAGRVGRARRSPAGPRSRATRAEASPGPRVVDAPARRRVARIHPAAGGRRAAAELRAAARGGRGDGPGDGPPDAAGSGVGRGRDRHVSAEERRAIGRRVLRARRRPRAVDLLPDHCFSHALVHLGFIRDEPNTSTALARAAALGISRRRRAPRRRRRAGR